MSAVNNRKNSTFITLGVGLIFVAIILVQFFSTGPKDLYYQEKGALIRNKKMRISTEKNIFFSRDF